MWELHESFPILLGMFAEPTVWPIVIDWENMFDPHFIVHIYHREKQPLSYLSYNYMSGSWVVASLVYYLCVLSMYPYFASVITSTHLSYGFYVNGIQLWPVRILQAEQRIGLPVQIPILA
jgi:hypothetical protein